jgi:uncharacterized RDD family membrane protein YckC
VLLDTDVEIESPEHVVFRHRVAGPARRAVAHVLDLVICYGTVFVAAIFVVMAGGGSMEDKVSGWGLGLVLLMVFAAQWVYFVVWEGLRGTTPGKMALGLRVLTTEGRPIRFAQSAIRNVLRAADLLPTAYLVGLGAMFATQRFQRLGDLAAGTMVVIVQRAWKVAPIRLVPPAAQKELASIAPRVLLDAEERTALELFLRRRGTLGPARERELADMIAAPLRERFGGIDVEPVRLLALLYDRAMAEGFDEAPLSSRRAR